MSDEIKKEKERLKRELTIKIIDKYFPGTKQGVDDALKEADKYDNEMEKLEFIVKKSSELYNEATNYAKNEPESTMSQAVLKQADNLQKNFAKMLNIIQDLIKEDRRHSEPYPLLMGVNSHKALSKNEIGIQQEFGDFSIDLKQYGVHLLEPDLFAGQKDLEKIALNHALNIQRDLKYTPLEQKTFDYCVYLAYLNGNTGAFYFTPDKILDGFGADKNTVQRRRIGKAFYSILNKKIEFKKTIKIKGLDYEIKVKNMALILQNGEIEVTEKTLKDKKEKIVESGRFIFDPELYSMISKFNYYAKGEKGAFLLTPEEYLIYKCFMEKARNEKKPELIKLSYLSVIEYANLTDKIKVDPSYISHINKRLETIKDRGLFKDFSITFNKEKQALDWYKNTGEPITAKNNTEINEALLKRYVINIILPDSIKNSLLQIKENHIKQLEKPKRNKKKM